MNPINSLPYRRPRESGGLGRPHRHINRLPPARGRRFAAGPWVPAFAGTTTENQPIGKYQFISSQALRTAGPPSVGGGQLVLRLGVEVAGVVALVQLLGRLAREAIDHAAAPHRRACEEGVGPALDVLVIL